MQLGQATSQPSLLDLRALHRENGSPLPLGQQLCWLLQLKVLPPVPRLRLPRLYPRTDPHGMAGHRLHG